MKSVSLVIFVFAFCICQAQEDSTRTKLSDVLQVSGYVKNMQILGFGSNLDDVTNDNLIHNRLNFRYFPNDNWTVGVEFRNRIFTGETVELIPDYADVVGRDDGFLDLSYSIINKPSIAMVSQVDRLWVEWSDENWEIRMGRQRINWGTNLFWNSNDLFNAYSLVDFDYEERAGSDALRVQRHFKNLSTLEVAIKPGKNKNDWIGGFRYGFNKWQYDFQIIGGRWFRDYAIGLGWAGNIGLAGFKGEVTYFIPSETSFDKRKILSASISVDYIFSNQLFLTAGLLVNSSGLNSEVETPQNLFLSPVSAKNLMPSKYNTILSSSFPVNELTTASIVTIYSPGVQSFLIMPSLGWSIANNWELGFFAQTFILKNDGPNNIGNGIFIRIKTSF